MKATPTVDPRPPRSKHLDLLLEEIEFAAEHAAALINAAATIGASTRLSDPARARVVSILGFAEQASTEVTDLLSALRTRLDQ